MSELILIARLGSVVVVVPEYAMVCRFIEGGSSSHMSQLLNTKDADSREWLKTLL